MIGLLFMRLRVLKRYSKLFFFWGESRFIGASNVNIPSKVLHIALIDYRDFDL